MSFDINSNKIPLGVLAGQCDGVFAGATTELERDGVVVAKDLRIPTSSQLEVFAVNGILQRRLEHMLERFILQPLFEFSFAHSASFRAVNLAYFRRMAGERVLFAVLDWGLGHATRSTPLISDLLTQGCEVVLAGTGRSLAWLGERFPELERVTLPTASIRYARYANALAIAAQTPQFLRNIQAERAFTNTLVQSHNIDRILSDNCYGVRHAEVHSTLVTHQLHLAVPSALRPISKWLLRQQLQAFDEIWVPDEEEAPGLAGQLSHPPGDLPVRYIGLQSQFTLIEARQPEIEAPLVALISGPEPHRQLFEHAVRERFRASGRQAVIFSGTGKNTRIAEGCVTTFGNADAATIKGYLLNAEAITCRSGYSTLMDLQLLGVLDRVEDLVPTPGQWEQKYLAKLHRKPSK